MTANPPVIPTIPLPNGAMPQLGLGTWQMTGTECQHAVRKALEIGYRHIDTAELYKNEESIGKAIKESGVRRPGLFITSKVMPQNADYDGTLAACHDSLERLKTDYLDLYLLHWPGRFSLQETFRAFRHLLDKGVVRDVGISNFNEKQVHHALDVAKKEDVSIAVNQVEFHPYLYQKKLLDDCTQNGIHVTAYSPVARGVILDDPVLNKVAAKHGKTVAQVSLRWLLQLGTSVIPKASQEKHLEENLGACAFTLDPDDMDAIGRINVRRRLVPL